MSGMNEYSVIAKVDIPEGTTIEIDIAVHQNIMKGWMKGEVVKRGGHYVLQEAEVKRND